MSASDTLAQHPCSSTAVRATGQQGASSGEFSRPHAAPQPDHQGRAWAEEHPPSKVVAAPPNRWRSVPDGALGIK